MFVQPHPAVILVSDHSSSSLTREGKNDIAGFVQTLAKARAKATDKVDYTERGKQLLGILKKYDYSDGLTPQMTVDILRDLGPTFVKIGQIASTHTDMLPVEYCDAFAKLRSSVTPMDAQTVHA